MTLFPTVQVCSWLQIEVIKRTAQPCQNAAPRAVPCSYKNAQKLLLAITQIIAMDSFCCENIYTSAVKQDMNCFKLPPQNPNVFLMMGNGKEELSTQPARDATALSDVQAQGYCSVCKLWCGRRALFCLSALVCLLTVFCVLQRCFLQKQLSSEVPSLTKETSNHD